MRLIFMAISFTLALGQVPWASAGESVQMFPGPIYVTLQDTGAVETLPAGTTWEGLDSAHYDAISPAGTHLLVSSKDTDNVYVVDTATGKTLATFTSARPHKVWRSDRADGGVWRSVPERTPWR